MIIKFWITLQFPELLSADKANTDVEFLAKDL